jgi:hypothetical protein
MTPLTNTIELRVEHCPRCKKGHDTLTFQRAGEPVYTFGNYDGTTVGNTH